MKVLHVVLLFVLLFGCLKPLSGPAQNQTITPGQNVTPPQQNVTPPVPPAAPQENETPQQNITPEQNYTPPPPPPPVLPPMPSTNLSINDLLNQRLDAIPYPSGGPYTVKKYIWVSNEFESESTDIVLNPTNTVLFNNRSERNLIGLAFKVYTPQTGLPFADGVAITSNRSVMLDDFTASGDPIELEFLFPGLERTLHGVVFVDEGDILDSRNRTLAIYTYEATSTD